MTRVLNRREEQLAAETEVKEVVLQVQSICFALVAIREIFASAAALADLWLTSSLGKMYLPSLYADEYLASTHPGSVRWACRPARSWLDLSYSP